MARADRPGAAHGRSVLEDAAQAAGASYEGRRAGALGDAASLQLLPRQEPRRGRRRRGDPDRRRRGRADGPDAACTRPGRDPGCTSRSATTRASTSSRRRRCACCCLTSRAGRRRAAPRPAPTSVRGSASSSDASAKPPGAQCAYHLYVVRTASRDALARRAAGGRRRDAGVLHDAAEPPAGARRRRGGPRRCRTLSGSRPTGLALPMGQALDESAVESGRRRDPDAQLARAGSARPAPSGRSASRPATATSWSRRGSRA